MGELSDTDYDNAMVMHVAAPDEFLVTLEHRSEEDPTPASSLAWVLPVTEILRYQ
jgi:hypothetical protein